MSADALSPAEFRKRQLIVTCAFRHLTQAEKEEMVRLCLELPTPPPTRRLPPQEPTTAQPRTRRLKRAQETKERAMAEPGEAKSEALAAFLAARYVGNGDSLSFSKGWDAATKASIDAINENAGAKIRAINHGGHEVDIHEGVSGWPISHAIAYGAAIGESIEAIHALTPERPVGAESEHAR
jgi:hypothetical protein